jgi:tetratricopeptide (TPR) repeat protein
VAIDVASEAEGGDMKSHLLPAEFVAEGFVADEANESSPTRLALLMPRQTPRGSVTKIHGTPTLHHRGSPAEIDELMVQLLDGLREQVPIEEAEAHYDLGMNYLSIGQPDAAVRAFQTAYRHPDWRLLAGECLCQAFVHNNQPALARKTAMTLLGILGEADDVVIVGVLYWRGRAAELMSRWAEAEDCFSRVAVIDSLFYDAADRLERIAAEHPNEF